MILIIIVLLILLSVFCFKKAKKMMQKDNKTFSQYKTELSEQFKEIAQKEKAIYEERSQRANAVFNVLSNSSQPMQKETLESKYKKLDRLLQKGENTDELEQLEKSLHAITFKYFLYEEIVLDIPIKILNLSGKFITDSQTLNFLKETPFDYIFEEHGDRYGDVLNDFKDSKKAFQQTFAFRNIIESRVTLEEQKKQIDDFFSKSKKLLNETLNIDSDDDWKDFKKQGLTISDYLLALSFYNHGNESAFVLYLNNIKTQEDYKKLNEESLAELKNQLKDQKKNINISQIISFKNYFANLQDTREIWLFDSSYRDWKKQNPLAKLENKDFVGIDSL